MGKENTDYLKNFISIDTDKLVKAVWNYKVEDEFMQTQLEGNLKRHGQVENILIRKLKTGYYEVVNGNHRYEAIKKLGWKKVVAYDLGDISESEAKRIAIMTNETRFDSDRVKLAQLMKQIQEDIPMNELKDSMPYSQEQMENMTKLLDFNWEQPGPRDPAEESTDLEGWRTVHLRLPEGVADQLEAQIMRFKKLLHPNDRPEDVSPVQAVEAMVQNLAQIEDSQAI